MTDSTNTTSDRVIDLDEVGRLIAPYTHPPASTWEYVNTLESRHLAVTATLLFHSSEDHAAGRAASVEAGNAAIAAVEAAGYEHASAPKITIDGIDVPDFGSESVPYLVDATLTMTLLGKRAP